MVSFNEDIVFVEGEEGTKYFPDERCAFVYGAGNKRGYIHHSLL